jgi:hypothetical protein
VSPNGCATGFHTFWADNAEDQIKLEARVRACYATRFDIVHGRWEDSEDFHKVHMYDTEGIVRTVIRHISDKPGMLGAFISLSATRSSNPGSSRKRSRRHHFRSNRASPQSSTSIFLLAQASSFVSQSNRAAL